jgi:glycosyltransferase involved in cell wall biosynthesis
MSVIGDRLSGRRDTAAVGEASLPSVLAVTSELPWPLNTGGHLRTFHLLRALSRRLRVRLVSAVLAGQESGVESLDRMGIAVCPALVAARSGWKEALRAATAAARGQPYVLFRRHDRRAVRAELARQITIEAPDVLYLDHLDSLVYDDLRRRIPTVIDLHNVYSTLVRRVSTERNPQWKRWYLRRESGLLAKMERRAACVADALMAVSEEEGRYFRELGARRAVVVPNGVDCELFRSLPCGRADRPPLILYLGSMSWGPNVSAAAFVAREVLPGLRDRRPGARLRIVGRSPGPEVRALGDLPGVEVVGDAPDIRTHLREARVLAVPLDAGGGTRLKILEAFAAGLPVVSTPVGCEGIDAIHNEHLVIAQRDQFLEGLLPLLGDPALGVRLATRARELVRDRYDWDIVGEIACEVVRDLIHPSRGSAREPR